MMVMVIIITMIMMKVMMVNQSVLGSVICIKIGFGKPFLCLDWEERERESWRNLKATMPSAKVGKGGERETIKGLYFGFLFNCHFDFFCFFIWQFMNFNFSMCPIKWLWHYGSQIKHIFFPQTKFNLEFQLKFV